MLTGTDIIQYIEGQFGFKLTDLELSTEEVMDYIKKYSLHTFSKYFPNIERIRLDYKEDLVEGTSNLFWLKTENEIINVNRVISSSLLGINAIVDAVSPISESLMLGDPITAQSYIDTLSMIKNPVTFIFYPPNKIEIAPVSSVYGHYIIFVNTVHPDHFGTIPENLRNEFMELCLYDIQEMIYHIRTRFNNLQTSFGNIELFLDDIRDARQNKRDLIEQFRKSSLRYARRKKLIIA